jgi:anaerobic selenocysteine-containing dehydrogenase
VGFHQLEAEVLPRFTPARVVEITGLAVDDIERLARMYGAARRPFIRIGEGMTRLARGGEALRAVALLPGVTGAFGRRGGGALLLTAASCEAELCTAQALGTGGNATGQSSAARRRAVEHDGPAATRPVHRCEQPGGLPRCRQVRRGYCADLFTVVHDPFLSVTARYADIVLPAATYLESEDFYRAYGTYGAIRPRCGAAAGEAWSNFAWRRVARRMGLADPVFRMSAPEALAELFRGATGRAAELDLDEVRSGRPIRLAPAGAQEFRTPSGKLEFYSEQLATAGLAPMPDWEPDPEEQRDAARWPLRLLTAPGYFQAHTAYSGVDFLRRREGEPYCILHPEEAQRRGLTDGAKVRLFNDRGTVGLILKLSDEELPGVVLVPGQRPDEETLGGTVNMLCSDRYTDLGEGATYQSTFLDISAWD